MATVAEKVRRLLELLGYVRAHDVLTEGQRQALDEALHTLREGRDANVGGILEAMQYWQVVEAARGGYLEPYLEEFRL